MQSRLESTPKTPIDFVYPGPKREVKIFRPGRSQEETEAVIPQQGLYLARGALYVELRVEGLTRLFRLPFDESPVVEVPVPDEGTIQEIAADPREPGLVFALESPTLPRLARGETRVAHFPGGGVVRIVAP